ncbi:type I secretion system permease/ATPase [Aliiroseovarius crassostreae]|uniref:type I secretion system permease/ATPase n=1 Tax=Aliiroseovarius crassostreae TaxID=154981 RepID=UPI0021AFCA65|nr:type I secretion system permease/ATPase [Aliiroseovarius crassostreae]UWP87854.1 type I secretion system permease/ATPase [Aliiroseovarius crassostreae]
MSADQPKQLSLALAKSRGLIRLAFFFSIFTNLLMLTGPLFMLQVYDRVLGSRSEETLVALVTLVTLLFALYGLLDFARGRLMARVGARFQALIGPRAFDALLETHAFKPADAHPKASLQDVDAIRTLYTSPVLLALFDLPWTPVFLAAIFIFHPLLGWLATTGGAILVVTALLNQLLTHGKVQEAQTRSSSANSFAAQALNSAQFAWAQGMGRVLGQRWRQKQDEALGKTIRVNDLTGSLTSFTKAFRFFLQSAMLGLGALLVLQNELTAGAMIAGSILLGRALAPIEQGLPQWPVVQRARSSWRNLSALLHSLPRHAEPTRLPPPSASLNARDIGLMVQGREKPVLRNITFYVAPGEALGIIGKSGSGKTTLARVLLGLVVPTAGEVRIGGATLPQYGPDRLGELIGYLPQEIQFFEGTITENIARMSLDPVAELVVDAAQKARVHDVILELPNGYDTRIGPMDTKLSGGQKQRLALARALYGNPIILVLDEPNSALDAEGSEALNAAIADMKANEKAIVVMTHRPRAIAQCDQLVVLEKGQVARYGPRDEVIQSMIKNADNVHKAIKQR